jgi:uncharacterized protein (DUF1684 family)
MRSRARLIGVALLTATGCDATSWARPPAIPLDRYSREFHEWRAYRHSRLIAPGPGPVTWVGLWELKAEPQAIGADRTLPIVLADVGTPNAGTLQQVDSVVRFEPAAASAIRLADGKPVSAPLTLMTDRTDSPTVLAVGSVRLRVHGEPGTDRLWLRAWDEEHPDRHTFTLPESFPLDTMWRVAARFKQFKKPREYRVVDIFEGNQSYRSPGELQFRIGGKKHRLVAFADSGATAFFVMMWDSTAKTSTYEAGRYLRVPLPDSTGWTEIDFNRAYNPPCVFTPYSTCAFAPPENRLALPVLAGEKRPARQNRGR